MADPLLGHVIADRYRLLRLIGRGGMGVVYQVEHVRMGKLMAMKLLHGELSRDPEVVRRFRREAQAASQLKHLNTVSIFDFGRADGLMYLVMEYIDGADLGRILRAEQRIGFTRAAGIFEQVCGSLAEAHEQGIVHRDLKPENVLISSMRDMPDFVKVLDFGLAKLRETEDRLEITSQGSIIGTPYYMAPEQIRGGAIDARADIYSVGAVLFKALTGRPPFTAANPIGVLTKHMTEPVPRLSDVFAELDLPPIADRIVQCAMAKEPDGRYARIDELRNDLLDHLGRVDEGSASSRWRRRSPGASLGAAEVIALRPPSGPAEAAAARVIEVATRKDFDAFERRLRRRGVYVWLVPLLLACGVAGAAGWYVKNVRWAHPTEEQEPNNDSATATALYPNEPIDAYLGRRVSPTESDRDVFVFERPAGSTRWLARVEATGIPNMDTVLELVPAGQSRPEVKADGGGVGAAEVLSDWALRAPRYFVVVRELWVDGRRPTENVSDRYTVRLRLHEQLAGMEAEPDDSVETANALAADVIGRGHLSGADVDVWCPSVPGVRPSTLRLTAAAPAGVDLILRLLGGSGSRDAVVDARGRGEVEEATLSAAPGSPPRCVEVALKSEERVGLAIEQSYELRLRERTP